MQLSFTEKKSIRKNFGKLKETLSIPNLIEVQKNSYNEFLNLNIQNKDTLVKGLARVFKSIFPIEDVAEKEVDEIAPAFGHINQRIYDLCGEEGYRKLYIQKKVAINVDDRLDIIYRNNVYSTDRNSNILNKLNRDKSEIRKENLITSFNSLTTFFKRII